MDTQYHGSVSDQNRKSLRQRDHHEALGELASIPAVRDEDAPKGGSAGDRERERRQRRQRGGKKLKQLCGKACLIMPRGFDAIVPGTPAAKK